MTVDGNKVSSVHNDVSGSTSVYSYDTNGRVVSDSARGVLSVGYNSLPLPERVEFADGAITSYVYDAEGRKLRTVFQTQDRTVTTDYCGGLLFENDVPTLLLTETGYFALTDSLYRHYIYDHQGNVRVVKREDGIVEETNDYYPFGGQIETISQGDVQPFKYSGKEIETRHGIGWYDFGARRYDHDIARWTTMDPLSEKYYSVSPYAFCNNNPVNFVDPDGKSPVYNILGHLIGTDDEGLKGEAIIMNDEDFIQGMSHNDALSYNLGKDGLQDPSAVHNFKISYNALNQRPDWDGKLTLKEAKLWYNEGSGLPLYVDSSQIDLQNFTIPDLGGKISDYYNTFEVVCIARNSLQISETGLVYGNILVTDISNGYVMLGNPESRILDTYDFDIRGKSLLRDIFTLIGKLYNGAGVKYNIYTYGKKKISDN